MRKNQNYHEFRTWVKTPPRCPKDSSDGEGITAGFHLGGSRLSREPSEVVNKKSKVKSQNYFFLPFLIWSIFVFASYVLDLVRRGLKRW